MKQQISINISTFSDMKQQISINISTNRKISHNFSP